MITGIWFELLCALALRADSVSGHLKGLFQAQIGLLARSLSTAEHLNLYFQSNLKEASREKSVPVRPVDWKILKRQEIKIKAASHIPWKPFLKNLSPLLGFSCAELLAKSFKRGN